MTKIDFVPLDRPEKAIHLCRLAAKHLAVGARVLILVEDDNQGVTLDRFMWTYEKGSFLPHAYDNGTVECLDEPVVVGTQERNPNGARVLIMSKPCELGFIRQFDYVVDFAELYEPELKQASRARFSQYREAGFSPGMLE